MSFPSHRTSANGDVSKGFSQWRQKGGPARICRCGVIRRIRRFLLEWHSRETIKGDIPRRQESAELLSGRKPTSRAWRFGEEISGSLPTRLLVIGVTSPSCRGRRLNSRECRFNRAQSTVYNANYIAERLIDLHVGMTRITHRQLRYALANLKVYAMSYVILDFYQHDERILFRPLPFSLIINAKYLVLDAI